MKIVRLPAIHHDANAILVIGSEQAAVIDTGTAWYQALQVERLKSHLEGKKLHHILLTSRRYPCSGAAKFIQEHFERPTILMHPEGISALETGDFFTTWANRYDSDMPPTEAQSIENGTNIDLGECSVEIVYTPGHAIDGISYRILEKNTWVLGALLPRADRPTRWDLPGGSLMDIIESLCVIRAQKPSVLIPMHGPSIQGKEHIREVLQRHIDFFEDCKQRDGTIPSNWARPNGTSLWYTPRSPWPLLEREEVQSNSP